jgi:hypothetical protein
MREHLVDKYFGYRRRYVDHFIVVAPGRAMLAVTSEIVRLGFVAFGSGLCAAIFWLLSAGTLARASGLDAWVVASFALAALTTGGSIAALAGIFVALADRRRVEEAIHR